MTFPQVVKGLLEVGVESYLVDFAAKQKTHYLADGTRTWIPMILEPGPIAAEFDGADLVAAFAARRPTQCGTPSSCSARQRQA